VSESSSHPSTPFLTMTRPGYVGFCAIWAIICGNCPPSAPISASSKKPQPPTEESYPPAISLAELRHKLFPDLYGMEAEKEFLIEHLYLPLRYPNLTKKYGLSLTPMIIVEGPPRRWKKLPLSEPL
jgi:hypothetical protein